MGTRVFVTICLGRSRHPIFSYSALSCEWSCTLAGDSTTNGALHILDEKVGLFFHGLISLLVIYFFFNGNISPPFCSHRDNRVTWWTMNEVRLHADSTCQNYNIRPKSGTDCRLGTHTSRLEWANTIKPRNIAPFLTKEFL